MENNDEFLKEWDEVTKPVCEKHKKMIVPVFRFGEQILQAQLIVKPLDEVSDKSKTDQSADNGDKTAKE